MNIDWLRSNLPPMARPRFCPHAAFPFALPWLIGLAHSQAAKVREASLNRTAIREHGRITSHASIARRTRSPLITTMLLFSGDLPPEPRPKRPAIDYATDKRVGC